MKTYERIYLVVRRIPYGNVATYGQIASIVGNCTPRMVGYALSALSSGSDVPWQRVINAEGKISLRDDEMDGKLQRCLLENEGIVFTHDEKIDLKKFGVLTLS